ncbi:MAG: efflux RND transporter periplasmic adaptor subunit [Bacteroidota bacterium]
MKYSLLVFSIAALVWVTSCHRAPSGQDSKPEEQGAETAQSGELVLTKDQFDESSMKVGDPSLMQFSNEISANGMIVASLSGKAKINTLIPGRIKHIHKAIGETVTKGEALFILESNDIVILQQDYAEVVHQLELLKADYERQKTLSDAQIGARKDFLRAESEYLTTLARAEGLKARLRMIQMDPSQVENGTIVSSLTVHAPIGGVITRQELVLGQFIEPQEPVMEVVDTDKLQLLLQVFDKDLAGLAPGQKVEFYTPGQHDRIYEASISQIGKSIDPETKTIQCIAKLQPGDQGAFVNNLYVESRIITCQREALAIPEEALIREPERDYVWILTGQNDDRLTFRKVPVRTGVTRHGFTEVLDADLKDVLLEGAYNLGGEE